MIVLALNLVLLTLLTAAFLPQSVALFKTKVADGVSPFFWLLISLSTSYSLFNLLSSGNGEWYSYLGQIINAGMSFIILARVLYIRYGVSVKGLAFLIAYMVVNGTVYYFTSLEVSQSIATAAIVAAYVDQLIHFARKRTADGTKPSLYFLFAAGLALLVVIMVLTNASIYVVITEVVNIILLLICGTMSTVLGRKNK